jgi:hypothetical protein
MRVQLETEGGIAYFPGLSRPVIVDSADLPSAQAAQLQQLIESADFFALPAAPTALRKGAADVRQYTITVEDGKRRHTVRLADPVENSDLQALIEFLQEQRDQTESPSVQQERPERRKRSSKKR